MANQPAKREQLSPYHEALLERACAIYARLSELSGYEAEQFVYQEIKSLTLESWKNGVEAGRRRATKPTRSTKRP